MFPFIGIQADEEPKTPISASGLYNSSDLGGLASDSDLSSTLFNNASELTFMMWISVDDFSIYTPVPAKPFIEFNPISHPISINSTGIQAQLANSNGGDTIATHFRSFSENTFYHICVTQSLLNNRIRIYVDGILSASAVMNYSNSSLSTTARLQNEVGVSIAQLNVFNRELSEAEVAEHYVYDDDTMSSGVLGWDAMTPAQKSGLIYSSSYTDDISISGNEFNDKSGSGITISPQPSLTGQQIYFYTDASDLPSDTTIYNVNSATLNGTSQYLDLGDNTVLNIGTSSWGASFWVKGNSQIYASYAKGVSGSPSGRVKYCGINVFAGGEVVMDMSVDNMNAVNWRADTFVPQDGGWHHVYVYRVRGGGDAVKAKMYIDGIESAVSTTVSVGGGWDALDYNVTSESVRVGGRALDNTVYYEQAPQFTGYFIGQEPTEAEVEYLYNLGQIECWEDVETDNPTLYAKFDEVFDFGTYNVSTEVQALTGKKNGWIFTNVNSAPFVDQGLTVECTS